MKTLNIYIFSFSVLWSVFFPLICQASHVTDNHLPNRLFDDIVVNQITSNQQLLPEIAVDPLGNFVIVWQDDQDGNGFFEILAAGFDVNGNRLFNDFTVNDEGNGQQLKPQIAMDDEGNFVVVWEDDLDDNGFYQILAAGFDLNGNRLFNDFTVNDEGNGQQLKPQIAMDDEGNFVVVWEDDLDENGYYQILAAGFDVNGNRLFNDFVVNSNASGQQLKPQIAMDDEGNFAVVWEDDMDDNGYYQILAAGFDGNGNRLFNDFVVNENANSQQLKPQIAMDDEGNFAVVWEDDLDDNGFYQILAAGFDANGNRLFSDFTVNDEGNGQQLKPQIAMDDEGNFVVTWEDDMDENGFFEILTAGFNMNGSRLFVDFTVNQLPSGQQLHPSIGMSTNGLFVVAWQDDPYNNGIPQTLAAGFQLDMGMEMMDRIVDFTLIDADANQSLFTLNHGDTIYYSEIGTENINIQANTSPSTVGSVKFESSHDGMSRTENVYPYTIFGDITNSSGTNFNGRFLTPGTYQFTATPYSNNGASGERGAPFMFEFTIVRAKSQVESFTLVRADTDEDIGFISEGDVIDLGVLPTTDLNIRANTNPPVVGSVKFSLNYANNFRTENVAPYALAGDSPPGNYHPYNFNTGNYTLTATPYSEAYAQGYSGQSKSIHFSVVDYSARKAFINRGVNLYPNPTSGIITLEIDQLQNGTLNLNVFDLLGRSMLTKKVAVNHPRLVHQLDVSRLPKGTYHMTIQQNDRLESFRIVLQ